jgi:flagellar hook-basal body complex protein FliE
VLLRICRRWLRRRQAVSSRRPLAVAMRYRNKTEVNFSDLLMNSVKSLNEVRNHASMQTEKFMLGAPDVSLNDVMVDMQKSSLALNLGVQVRNKLVSAYQEVMSMPV